MDSRPSRSLQTTYTKPKALSGLLIPILIFVLLGYGVIAIGVGDPLWILQKPVGTPTQIAVHIEGETVFLNESDPRFDELSDIFKFTISHTNGYNQGLGISDQTLRDYREQDWSIEAFYTEPLILHSHFRFGKPRQALIPLSGRHANSNILFLGNQDTFYAGPYLKTTIELRRTLKENNLAPKGLSDGS